MTERSAAPGREDEAPSLLVNLSGDDGLGISTAVFAALRGFDVRVLDVEQAVLRGQLNLAILLQLGHPGAQDEIEARLGAVAGRLGLTATYAAGRGDNRPRRSGRVIVTVLGDPLRAAHVAAVTQTLWEHGANIDRIRRLSRWPVTTIELSVSGARADQLRREMAAISVEHRIDVAVAPAGLARRGRRLVVMDVDSTLIAGEVIEMLAEHAGRADEVRRVTESAMRGEIDFAASLHRRVAALAGLDAGVLDEVRRTVRLTPGAATLCRTLRELGFAIALVSGGFAEVVEPLGSEVGATYVRANRLEIADGVLTGRVLGPVVDRAAKADALREFADAEGLPLSRTVAIGDGANDLEMIAAAGLGIAFNAKPVVRAQADTSVSVPYLDSVLYLLGISSDDVAESEAQRGTVRAEDGPVALTPADPSGPA